MKLSRRDAIKTVSGVALASLPVTHKAHAWLSRGKSAGVTNFTQGFIGGGGYQMQMSFAADGTRYIHCDVSYVGKWNTSTGKWFPIITSPGMDPTGAKFATLGGSGCHAIATCKNDSSRVYMVFCSVSNPFFGFNQFPLGWSTVYRSDDGAQTWKATAFKTVQAQDSNASNYAHTSSPKMYVDPANKDICYLSMAGGFFFVTYNGGDNWHPVMTMLNAWPHATATNDVAASVSPGPINFSAIPSDVLTFNSNTFGLILYAYNLGGGGGPDGLGPLSLGSNGLGYDNGTANSTQFQAARITPRDGTTTSSPGVLTNDVIYFGAGGLVVIDDSNGTVPNPGTDPGCTGVASRNVFFASLHPAFLGGAVWLTTDGNPEHAVATTGGPTNAANIKVSNDKALVGGGNCVYLTTVGTQGNQNIWRYVGAGVPVGQSFTPNAWVNCGVTVNNQQNNGAQIAAPDPTTAGKLGIIVRNFQGSVALSTDYGGSLAGQNPPTFTSAAGQPPWITVPGTDGGVVTSDAWMDPINSGHLIWLSGIAVYDSVPAAGSGAVAANNVTAGLESLVVQKILKAPAPNGRILIACEDRPIFSTANASTYPANANPVTGEILQAGDVTYADDDPTVVFAGFAANVTRSQDSGLNFITIGTINALNGGTITAFGIFGNAGSGYVPGTYTNVPLTTSGLGTGGTADVVIGAGGTTTSFTVNQGGDLYAKGDSVSVDNSHLGGSGSGILSGILSTAPLKTTNGSNVVTITSIAHGYSTGRTVGISRSTPFNNINIEGLIQTITVTDVNHYTMTASTNANATGFGSGGVVEGLNGYIPPTDTDTGGAPNVAAPDKTHIVKADNGTTVLANVQVGIATGDPNVVANWVWKNCLAPVISGSPFLSAGLQGYANNLKFLDTDGAGNVYFLDESNGFIYKSTDGGQNFSKDASTGIIGNNLYSRMVCIRGKSGQLLMSPGNYFGNNVTGPLLYSTDSGQTWNQVSGTYYIWQVAIGKAKPGGSGFPAVFITGTLTNGGEPGLFRCDDFDGARTWIRLDNIRKITLQLPNWISGDPDNWGHVLVANGQSGYCDGTIS